MMKLFRQLLAMFVFLFFFRVALGNEVEADEEPLDKQENNETTNEVERFVWPFTRWFEESVQNTSLIRSPRYPESPSETSVELTIREAIRRATKQFPGTVLNAEKVTESGAAGYDIRIISSEGIVKTLRISNAPLTDKIQAQPDNHQQEGLPNENSAD